MNQQHFSGRLIFLTLSGFLLLALGLSSVPVASAGRIPPSPAVEITEALTNTPAPTATITPIYFLNPTLPSCVGAGCTSPSGYNNIVSATLNEQSLYAYDPSSKYWTGGGRVETKIKVNGAGIGTVRLYYAYNGVNCDSGYAVYVFKLSGNVNYPNLLPSGYFDVTVTSSDQGSFSFYTRCSSSGSYTGEYGIDNLWYSLVEPATPTPTATATLTNTPTRTPTITPTSAVPCYGSTCNGLYANPMGCDGHEYVRIQNYKYLKDTSNNTIGLVQNRISLLCYAQWEKTINISGDFRYTEGSIRWGGANYDEGIHPQSSPWLIDDGQSIYTAMYGIDGGSPDFPAPTLACGGVSSDPLSVPYYDPPDPEPILPSYPYYQNNCAAN